MVTESVSFETRGEPVSFESLQENLFSEFYFANRPKGRTENLVAVGMSDKKVTALMFLLAPFFPLFDGSRIMLPGAMTDKSRVNGA